MYYHGVFESHPFGWPWNSLRRAGVSFSASYALCGVTATVTPSAHMLVLSKEVTPELSSNDHPSPSPLSLKLLPLIKIHSALQRPQSACSNNPLPSLPPSSLPSSPPSFLCWKIEVNISDPGRGRVWLEEKIVANEQVRWVQYPSPQYLAPTFPPWPCHLTPWLLALHSARPQLQSTQFGLVHTGQLNALNMLCHVLFFWAPNSSRSKLSSTACHSGLSTTCWTHCWMRLNLKPTHSSVSLPSVASLSLSPLTQIAPRCAHMQNVLELSQELSDVSCECIWPLQVTQRQGNQGQGFPSCFSYLSRCQMTLTIANTYRALPKTVLKMSDFIWMPNMHYFSLSLQVRKWRKEKLRGRS